MRRVFLLSLLLAVAILVGITPVAAQDAPAFDYEGELCFDPNSFVFDGYKAGKAFTQPGIWHFMRVVPTTEDAVSKVQVTLPGHSSTYFTKASENAQGQLRVKAFYTGLITSFELHCLDDQGLTTGWLIVNSLTPPQMTELALTNSGRLAKVTGAHIYLADDDISYTRHEKVQLRFRLSALPQTCTLEFKHLGAPVLFRALDAVEMLQVVEVELPAATPKQMIMGKKFQLEASFDTIVIAACVMGGELFDITPRVYSIG